MNRAQILEADKKVVGKLYQIPGLEKTKPPLKDKTVDMANIPHPDNPKPPMGGIVKEKTAASKKK